VTIVLPARNAADTLRRQLEALDRQTFDRDFAVVVVDNGSVDGTSAVASTYRPERYRLGVIRERRIGINAARNAGIAAVAEGMIFLCDADDEVSPAWLASMAAALHCGVWVGGVLDYVSLNSPRTRRVWHAPKHSTFRPSDPYVDDTKGSSCGFTRAMWAELGGFDDRLSGSGGDENEFFMRAYAAGYRPCHVPTAVVAYRLRPGLAAMMRQRFRQGRNQIAMSVLPGGRLLPYRYTLRRCTATLLRVVAVAPRDLASADRRYLWLNSVSRHAGRVAGLSIARVRRSRGHPM